MPLVLGATYDAPSRTPTPPSAHKRSLSTESTTSTSSTISSSSTSSNSGLSLRERRGVTFRLSSNDLPAEVDALEPKGHLEPRFNNVPRRRRALPMPLTIFDPTSVMGEAGAKSSCARDFGMGEDGWTVVAL
ncbi:hypothetical protein C0995_008810 [Termitomyces sp. Mi166|nr:hypothetical protein C0995_008810 [Termitomyces sp. Mi166\